MTIATLLREARADLGLTRKAVADATGIPIKTLEKFENGQAEPNISRGKALAHYLGIDFMELADEADGRRGSKPVKIAAPARKLQPSLAELDPSASDVGEVRQMLKEIGSKLGLEVRTTEHTKDGGTWTAPVVASLIDREGRGVDLSPEQLLLKLGQIAEATGPNSAETRRALRLTKDDLGDLEPLELLDLAEEVGLSFLPEDEDGVLLGGSDQDPGEITVEALIARLLVNSVFGYEPADLEPKALNALHMDLIAFFELEDDEREHAWSLGRDGEDLFDCQQRIAAKLMLEALMRRQAPELSNAKAYPKRRENEDD